MHWGKHDYLKERSYPSIGIDIQVSQIRMHLVIFPPVDSARVVGCSALGIPNACEIDRGSSH